MLLEVLERLERIEAKLERKTMPRSPGRKPINDSDALAEARSLIARGCEPWAAVRSVAAALGGNAKAHAQRLTRKLHYDP
jgi:hypothetical protein